MDQPKIILGIDPGTARIGYGVIEKSKSGITCIGYGLIEPKETDQSGRLSTIGKEIMHIIELFNPELVSVEKLFFSKNKKTALSVAEARGVIIATIRSLNVPIIELSPADAKAGVTGYGNAKKDAVGMMVRKMLKIGEKPIIDDTLDALALAITAAYGNRLRI